MLVRDILRNSLNNSQLIAKLGTKMKGIDKNSIFAQVRRPDPATCSCSASSLGPLRYLLQRKTRQEINSLKRPIQEPLWPCLKICSFLKTIWAGQPVVPGLQPRGNEMHNGASHITRAERWTRGRKIVNFAPRAPASLQKCFTREIHTGGGCQVVLWSSIITR